MSNRAGASIAIMETVGVNLYPWQRSSVKHVLGLDERGRLTAPTVGLSVPRQNGKSLVALAVVFSDSVLTDNLLTVWTAHRFKVAREAFRTLAQWARHPAIRDRVAAIHTAAGNEAIIFNNGSRIVFAARERGAIRGFAKVERLVLDEAQILSADALSDLLPTMNAARDPQVIYAGTPPRPVDPGESFRTLRKKALSGEPRTLWLEWTATGDDLDDREEWRRANPSAGYGTTLERLADLRVQIPNDADFGREALGKWDELSTDSLLSIDIWHALTVAPLAETAVGEIAVGVDVSPDRSVATVGVALWHPETKALHVEVARSLPGTEWVIPYLIGLRKRRKVRAFVLDSSGPAASLIEPARSAGLPITTMSTGQVVAATGLFYDRFHAHTLSHRGDPALTAAVKGATKRSVGDAWTWQRRDQDVNLTPLVAATFAGFGLVTANPAKTETPRQKVSTTYYTFN